MRSGDTKWHISNQHVCLKMGGLKPCCSCRTPKSWVYPQEWRIFHGKSHEKLDDFGATPTFSDRVLAISISGDRMHDAS